MIIRHSEAFYFLLCENESEILLIFDGEENYFQEYEGSLSLEKYGDFSNLSAYYFNYIGKKDNTGQAIKKLIWIDKSDHKYCGSFANMPIDKLVDNALNTEKTQEFYNDNKDFLSALIDNEVAQYYEMIDAGIGIDFKFDRETTDIIVANNIITLYDNDTGKKYEEEIRRVLDVGFEPAREKIKHINKRR